MDWTELIAWIGWVVSSAGWAWCARRARLHRCVVDPPPSHVNPDDLITQAVLVDGSGQPESIRILRSTPPKEYTRPHGREAATVYARDGVAAVYRATPRQ